MGIERVVTRNWARRGGVGGWDDRSVGFAVSVGNFLVRAELQLERGSPVFATPIINAVN